MEMFHQATRKQHDNQKPQQDENPNRIPGKDGPEDHRNPGQDRNSGSINPPGDQQRRETPNQDRAQQDSSREPANRQGGEMEKVDGRNRRGTNPSREVGKNSDSEKARRSQNG
jgi:hypothetical protein